jgi:uncharacterized membrane protein
MYAWRKPNAATFHRGDAMNFIKTTVLGGLVFLVPVVALVLVLGKVYEVMLTVAEPMAELVPLDVIGGVAIANVIAVLIILFSCFAAGLVARAGPAKRFAAMVENAILQKIPGYSMIKGMTASLTPEKTAQMHAVLVSLGYSERVGLATGRMDDGRVTVYFPGSPNAWSGEVHVVPADQVEQLEVPITAVIEHAELLGRDSRDILAARSRFHRDD